jgi:hypothetical protein
MRFARIGLVFGLVVVAAVTRARAGDASANSAGDITASVQTGGANEEYAAMIGQVIDFVGAGEFDKAIGVLDAQAARPPAGEDREKLKRLFAGIYSTGGEYDGHELVAVQPISGRLHKAYALGYHEKRPVLYVFTMYQYGGKWKISHLHWDETLDPLARLAPSHFVTQ